MQQSPLNASEISEIIKKRIESIDINTPRKFRLELFKAF